MLFHVAATLAGLVGLKVAHSLYLRLSTISQGKQLGARAALIPSYLPFGLDFMYGIIRANSKYRALEYWEGLITAACGPTNKSFTAEFYPLFGPCMILTTSPTNMKAILATHFNDYGKGPEFARDWKDFLGRGIFVVDGEEWSHARKTARPAFAKTNFEDLQIMEKHTVKLLEWVADMNGKEFDLKPLLYSWTMDIATDLFFGEAVGCLVDKDTAGFAKAFDGVEKYMAWKVRTMPFNFLLPKKQFRQDLNIMESVIEPYIRKALTDDIPGSEDGRPTFISSLARETRDRQHVRDGIMSILLAGRDTTAGTLSWCFLELARSPGVVQKLRNEIAAASGDEAPNYQQLKDMKYLSAVINETTRMYPALSWNFKHALNDTTLPEGGGIDGTKPVGVPRGTLISFCPLSMHRRDDLYPMDAEDPKQWYPDRWLSWRPEPWKVIPFSGGPRVCLGQNFAVTEMAYLVVRFLQTFSRIQDCGNLDVFQANMLLTPAEGVKLRVA